MILNGFRLSELSLPRYVDTKAPTPMEFWHVYWTDGISNDADSYVWWTNEQRVCGAAPSPTHRGDAAAASRIVRGGRKREDRKRHQDVRTRL